MNGPYSLNVNSQGNNGRDMYGPGQTGYDGGGFMWLLGCGGSGRGANSAGGNSGNFVVSLGCGGNGTSGVPGLDGSFVITDEVGNSLFTVNKHGITAPGLQGGSGVPQSTLDAISTAAASAAASASSAASAATAAGTSAGNAAASATGAAGSATSATNSASAAATSAAAAGTSAGNASASATAAATSATSAAASATTAGTASTAASGSASAASTSASAAAASATAAANSASAAAASAASMISTTAPTASAGSGLGSSPTVAITGKDTGFTLTLTTGTLPVANATIATVTFGTAFASAPGAVVFSPGNPAAAALSGLTAIYADTLSATGFIVKSGTTALTPLTVYKWYFRPSL